jgi:hypothetical protein
MGRNDRMTDVDARREIARLCAEHGLMYSHNAGGVAFYGPNNFHCQVYGMEDIEDLNRLKDALAKIADRKALEDADIEKVDRLEIEKARDEWRDRCIKLEAEVAKQGGLNRMVSRETIEDEKLLDSIDDSIKVAEVVAMILKMSPEAREAVFNELVGKICMSCYGDDPDCQCWNDE